MDRVLDMLRPQIEPIARQYADPARSSQSTADLLQESCLRAWNRIGSFQGGKNDHETFAMFRAWIGQIVRRLGMNAKRDLERQRRKPDGGFARLAETRPTDTGGRGAIEPSGENPSPSAAARGAEFGRQIVDRLDGLPDRTNATIVKMHVFEGLSFTQISERLGMAYETARERYWATVNQLQLDLKDWF